MKFLALLVAASAIKLQKEEPAHAISYNQKSEPIPSEFHADNDDVMHDPFHPDTVDVQTYPEFDGWKEAKKPDSAKNTCVNINKASGTEEPCSTVGNSAWNTLTSSKTAKPKDAQAAPYPLHKYHVDAETARTAK